MDMVQANSALLRVSWLQMGVPDQLDDIAASQFLVRILVCCVAVTHLHLPIGWHPARLRVAAGPYCCCPQS